MKDYIYIYNNKALIDLKARNFVRGKPDNAKEIKRTNLQRGKYFRVAANVLADGVSLENELYRSCRGK